jgi:carbon monoxide dehydrogenase subunit G
MISVSGSIYVARPVGEVWDYMTNAANDPEWSEGTIESRRDGELTVGSIRTFKAKFMGRELETVNECVECNPPHRLVEHSTSGPIDLMQAIDLAEADGVTNIIFTLEGEVGGFFKVAEGMVAKQAQSTLDNSLSALKSVLEG